MSEPTHPQPGPSQQGQSAQAQSIVVSAQYVKDLSYEVPGAPAIYGEVANGAPEISVRVDLTVQGLAESHFEVALKIGVDAMLLGKVAFIVELTYAGLFTVNVPEEHRQPILMIECPRLLFPFARNIIADVTGYGNFPPLMLQPIDFAALYMGRLEQAAAEASSIGQTVN